MLVNSIKSSLKGDFSMESLSPLSPTSTGQVFFAPQAVVEASPNIENSSPQTEDEPLEQGFPPTPTVSEQEQQLMGIGDGFISQRERHQMGSVEEVIAAVLSATSHPGGIGATIDNESAIILKVVIEALKLFENNQKILKAQQEIEKISDEIKSLDKNFPKIKELNERISILKEDIASEIHKNSKNIEILVTSAIKLSVQTTKEVTNALPVISHLGVPATNALSTTSGVAASVLCILTIVLSSKELNTNRLVASKITEEKEAVKRKLAETNQEKNPILHNMLKLRLYNLEQQSNENKINATRNALTLTAGVLGVVVAAKTIAVAAGVTVAGAFATAASATGIGAIVIGVSAIVVGLGYLAYKNRHAIQNKFQNLYLALSQKKIKKEMQNILTEKNKVSEALATSKVEAAPTTNKILEEEIGINKIKIDKVEAEIINLREVLVSTENNKPTKVIDKIKRIYKRVIIRFEINILERNKLELSGTASLLNRYQIVQRHSGDLSIEDQKLNQLFSNFVESNKKQREINVEYRYRKDIAKFGQIEDETQTGKKPMEVADLKQIHQLMCAGDPFALDETNKNEVVEYFQSQNKQAGCNVDVSAFQVGMNKEQFWDAMIQGVTSSVVIKK